MTETIVIERLNVGGVRDLVDDRGNAYRSAIRRRSVEGRQFLDIGGFARDESFESCHHTSNMDVHVFSLDGYRYYERMARRSLPIPTFGENFTVFGGAEKDVCIADLYQAGEALVEISQPTARCPTPGRNAGVAHLLPWIREALYTGYYMRVVQPGWVQRGDAFYLRERRYPQWSVDRVNRAVFRTIGDDALFEEIVALPLLSNDWKSMMLRHRSRFYEQAAQVAGLDRCASPQ